jgi:hypothetical protein
MPEEELAWRRESRERLRAQIQAGPHSPLHVLEGLPASPAWLLPDDALTEHDRLLRVLAGGIRIELARLAGALGAVDCVIEETRDTFNGVDPLPSILRETLESARAELQRSCALAEMLMGKLTVPDCDHAVLEQLRAFSS